MFNRAYHKVHLPLEHFIKKFKTRQFPLEFNFKSSRQMDWKGKSKIKYNMKKKERKHNWISIAFRDKDFMSNKMFSWIPLFSWSSQYYIQTIKYRCEEPTDMMVHTNDLKRKKVYKCVDCVNSWIRDWNKTYIFLKDYFYYTLKRKY